MSETSDGWGIDVPDPDVINFILKLDPQIKDEIYKKLKDECKVFDKFGSGPRRCTNALYKIDSYAEEGELYMKVNFANADKRIRITGFEVWKN
jgi:hypothetical protein